MGPKFDLEDAFTVFPKRSIRVNWYPTDAKYWDIGTPENLEAFRNYWAQLPKGGEGRMVGNIEDSV